MSYSLSEIKNYYDNSVGNRQKELANYYNGEQLPIDGRAPVSSAKAATHTNIHIDFFKDITELKVGYVGKSITYTVSNDNEILKEETERQLKMFSRINNMQAMNSQSIRSSSISGVSHRLVYTEDGIFKIKNIEGWNVIYDYKESIFSPEKAYYYYETIDLVGTTTKHCDVYDKQFVTYYVDSATTTTQASTKETVQINNGGTSYVKNGDPQLHNFNEVPLIPILNNDAMSGDCEKSTEVMDVYDEIISDSSAEVKAIRLAYLKVWGNLFTGEDADGDEIDVNTWLKQTSTMNFPLNEDGSPSGNAEFLEKNMNDTVIENILNRLRSHIYETSGSLDLKEITASERVFSIKASMIRLENNSAASELYMRAMLYKQTRLWAYWMNKYESIKVDDTDIDWDFRRNFPTDIESESRTLAALSNTLTLEDSLVKLGWENAKELAKRKEGSDEDLLKDDIKRLQEKEDDNATN